MIFPLNPRASYAIVYTISPCFFVFMFPSFRSISPLHVYVSMLLFYFTIFYYVYVSKLLALFHHDVCLCFHVFTLFHHILLCLCVQVTYTISPYWYVYVSKLSLYFTISCMFMFPHSFVLFHRAYLIVRVMYPYLNAISPCILYVYVSMCLLYFTIFYYVYVSKLLTLFHHTIMCLCVHVFVLFHHIY